MKMNDQAQKLRALVQRSMLWTSPERVPRPRQIVITGSQRQIGTSTLAVNLTTALAQQGRRVLLIDADLNHPDVSKMCGLDRHLGLGDILSSRRTIHEVLAPGPAGMQVVSGVPHNHAADWDPAAQQRLVQQISSLGRHIDFVILDVGCGATDATARFWDFADEAVLVAGTQPSSIMEAYATIKMIHRAVHDMPEILTLINQVDSASQADGVHLRLARSCQRFLSLAVGSAGFVPRDKQIHASAIPVVKSPTSDFARRIDRIAAFLATRAQPSASIGRLPTAA